MAFCATLVASPAYADPGTGHGGVATTAHLNGFEDRHGRWVPGLITNATWFRGAPVYSVGRATYYAAGVMEATAYAMGYSLNGYVDGIAMMSPADLGKSAWLRNGSEWEGPFLVVDYAAQTDMYSCVMFNREVVEVGWRTAERWDMVGVAVLDGIEVVLTTGRPPDDASGAVDYVAWWIATAEFTESLEGQAYIYDKIWEVPTIGVIETFWQQALLGSAIKHGDCEGYL